MHSGLGDKSRMMMMMMFVTYSISLLVIMRHSKWGSSVSSRVLIDCLTSIQIKLES